MGSRELFAEIVADFQSFQLPELTPRNLELPSLPGKVDAVIGMRRSGKTYFLFQQIKQLIEQGFDRERILYVNFEDERLLPFDASELHHLPEALYIRFPHLVGQECRFFLDEIQNVPGWERFLRRMVDTSSIRFVVSGSSAKLLSMEIASSLRGRAIPTEVLPFGFHEYLHHHGVSIPERWPPPEKIRAVLRHHLHEFLRIGGFPEIQALESGLRLRILRDYVDVLLLRDVIERHGISNIPALRYLVRRLLRSPASLFSVNRFFNELKSQGIPVAKDTLYEMLAHLQDAFLVFPTPIATDSVKKTMVNPRKVYLVDPALAGTVAFVGSSDTGHLLENIVYLELRRRGFDCGYVLTSKRFEVDFLVTRPGSQSALIQVCADLDGSPQTREREVRAACDASAELGIPEVTIVTIDQEETFERDGTQFRVLPAWQWLVRPVSL
ncbi:MAG: ATP-binding protein [Thermoanaerobaculales bacterium]|nr:ATP-binding protein [Thermoanaerobaculales bacterium]